jgi:hypothetical protein
MNQSSILRHCYDTVFEILKKEGEGSNLYSVSQNVIDESAGVSGTKVFLHVSDISQISQDKNGEKVIADETEFPAPTYMAFIITIEITAEHYQDVLETAGHIVWYFKDNNGFAVDDEYNWHGNESKSIFMEPIIREAEISRMVNHQGIPLVNLEYRLEAAINSKKGGRFTRVQSRDIRGKPMPQDKESS